MAKNDDVWRGPVIGVNKQGYPTPVFFDPHTSINTESTAGGVVITGSPGSGKSQLGMNLAIMSAIAGKKTIFLDFKSDSLGMRNLNDELGGCIDVWDMGDQTQTGSMDPYVMEEEKARKISKAYSLVEILVGNISDEQMTRLYPIISDVAEEDDPSLTRLMMKLLRHPDPAIEAIGTRLQAVQGSSLISSLIFKKGRGKAEKMREFNDGLTIITAQELSLPEQGSDPSSYRAEERLSLGIMYLITDYILTVMKDQVHKPEPKTVIIDEAWAAVANEAGYTTIESLFRLGRSLNTACILMTQNVSDLRNPKTGSNKLMNSAATQFAFKCSDREEAQILCKSLNISFNDFGDTFANLKSGWCVMKDFKGRVSLVYILQQNERWTHAFETNPWKKAKQQLEEVTQSQSDSSQATGQ